MVLDCLHGDHEPASDLAVLQALVHERQHLQLAESIARAEPKTNAVPTTGHAARSRFKPNFELQVNMEFAPSVFFNEVIEHIGNGRLADEMGHKIYPQLMISIFKALDSASFSLVPKIMYNARSHVHQMFDKYSDAIAANLWFTTSPTLSTVTDAIERKRRIARMFKDDGELALLEEQLLVRTGCPGWLPIEDSESVLSRANGHGGLTFERALRIEVEEINKERHETMKLFAFLKRRGDQLFKQREEAFENERYKSMPMSTARVAERLRRDSRKYPLPRFAAQHEYRLAANSVAFKDSAGKIFYRSRIALFSPALEVVELQDGNVVALVASSLIGLSAEEMEFLKPLYKATMMTLKEIDEKGDWVEKKRLREWAESSEAQSVWGASARL